MEESKDIKQFNNNKIKVTAIIIKSNFKRYIIVIRSLNRIFEISNMGKKWGTFACIVAFGGLFVCIFSIRNTMLFRGAQFFLSTTGTIQSSEIDEQQHK
jgi:hypothetical protein